MRAPRIGGLYRNWKNGHTYRVVGIGKHSETMEDMVAYQNEDGEMYFRPLPMWFEQINKDGYEGPRFIEAGDPHGAVSPVFGSTSRSGSVSKRGRI